jgi:hypothetical protein
MRARVPSFPTHKAAAKRLLLFHLPSDSVLPGSATAPDGSVAACSVAHRAPTLFSARCRAARYRRSVPMLNGQLTLFDIADVEAYCGHLLRRAGYVDGGSGLGRPSSRRTPAQRRLVLGLLLRAGSVCFSCRQPRLRPRSVVSKRIDPLGLKQRLIAFVPR